MTNNKKQQNYKSDSFFEAFRELGNDTKNAVKSIGSDMAHQISPFSQFPPEDFSDQPYNNEQAIRQEILQRQKKERAHFEHQRREERLIFSRKEQELKAQIEAIQEELKKILTEASELAQEVEIAVEQNVANPGIYHINFFNKLRQILTLLRKKISDSNTWMHTVNSRAANKSHFWGQVGKSGTKFMLSQERYTATQAG